MTFVEAVKSVFTNYTNFSGRARRSEFWWYNLCMIVVQGVLSFLSQSSSIFAILSTVVALGCLIPSLAVAVRRLHDIGKSGWYYLFALIPLVGSIILIIWFAKDSQPGDNAYGPNPKAVGPFDTNSPV